MKATNLAAWLIITTLFFTFCIMASDLLIPFVIALVIWYIITILNHWIQQIKIGSWHFPSWLSMTASLLTIIGGVVFVSGLIVNNASAMIASVQKYEGNVAKLLASVMEFAGVKELPNLSALMEQADVTVVMTTLVSTFSGIAGNIFIVLVYVLFLFMDQFTFSNKLKILASDPKDYKRLQGIIKRINKATRTYFSVKTGVSAITAGLCYIVLLIIGVDFALFWAFLIFLLNFIPNIGSLIAIIFPSLMALIQFESHTPFFVVLIGMVTVQLIVGNIIEPKMMGNSLNISSLVVIISLSVWGALWGVAGMFLSVPITVIMMIIFSQFPQTRPIAVLLSENGTLIDDHE